MEQKKMKNNIEEAKKWFKDLFQGCYLKKLDKYPNSIFWIYDKNLIRLRKLAKITGIEKYNLDMFAGEIIFDQDVKNEWFRIKYANYWQFLQSNFNLSWDQVKTLTTEVVNDVLNSKEYTPTGVRKKHFTKVNEVLNSKEYTTIIDPTLTFGKVNEILNCKEYTTRSMPGPLSLTVNEILHCKEYNL